MAYSDSISLGIKRLAELNRTRTRLEELEKRAEWLEELDRERRRLAILNDLTDHYVRLSPYLADMSHYVTELKNYLRAVHEADLIGDAILQSLTTEHCVVYTTRLMDLLADASKYSTQSSCGVLELATSTMAMFAQRPSVFPTLRAAGVLPVLVKLLSPLFPPAVVVNTANAAGHLAEDEPCRVQFRTHGGIGALVRLLRPDCEASVQTAAAAALSLLCGKDCVVQDSVRYLGGIELLVALLAERDEYLGEVARYCLQSVRHGNVKNQTEVIAALRSCSALIKDVAKLERAVHLLSYEEPAVLGAGHVTQGTSTRPRTAEYARPRTSLKPMSPALHHTEAARYTSPLRTSLSPHRASLLDARSPSPPPTWTSPSSLLHRDEAIRSSARPAAGGPARTKHLLLYSTDDVCALLAEAGFDKWDLRQFRMGGIRGSELLALSEEGLVVDMLLPRIKARKVARLQKATRLFDRISSAPLQGQLTEMELRLYLANQGVPSFDSNKLVKLFKMVVPTKKSEFVSFWDFITGYEWISQAFKIYSVPA